MWIRLIVSVLIGAGFLFAAVNLVLAYMKSRNKVTEAGNNIAKAQELFGIEIQEMNARTPEESQTVDAALAIQARSEARYAVHGIRRATLDNLPHLPAMEAQDVLQTIVDASRDNLIWAGIGLTISTGASVWGLWL